MKKVISPLIATVLIIGFTVALAGIVMTWGGEFIREPEELKIEVYEFQRGKAIEIEGNESIDVEPLKLYCLETINHLPQCYDKKIKKTSEVDFQIGKDLTTEQYQLLIENQKAIKDWVNNLSDEDLIEAVLLFTKHPIRP